MNSLNIEPRVGMVVLWSGGLRPDQNERKTIAALGVWAHGGQPTVEFDKRDYRGEVVSCFVEFFKAGWYEIEEERAT